MYLQFYQQVKRCMPVSLQVQKDALQKDYSNIKYEQPYQTAMYNQSVLCEAKRWHVQDYEEAIVDLTPQDLKVL